MAQEPPAQDQMQYEAMAQEALRPAVDLLRSLGVGAEVKAAVGPAPEAILSEIESVRTDLVVMGRSSRCEPKDLILGTVSHRVARQAQVPVLLVP
jgi:nucleotide-binding universal stress UspA family protein